MGASFWDYYVPYQADFEVALQQLREQVFASRDFYWIGGNESADGVWRTPPPPTIEALFEVEDVLSEGTHSILDMERMLQPGEEPDYGTVEPIDERDAQNIAGGVTLLTRAHVEDLEALADRRWFGRCAVLHNDAGVPTEIYFWGSSGD